MARKKKKGGGGGGLMVPVWILSYADMVTNLMVLFIVIAAFSSTKKPVEEERKIINAIRGGFGMMPVQFSTGKVPIPGLTEQQEGSLTNAIGEMTDEIAEQQLTESIKLQLSDRGLSIIISDKVMFRKGDAKLLPEMYPLLGTVAALARGWPNTIRIEGHTDNTAMKGDKYPTNWELSAARALSVLHYFQDDAGIDPRRLQAVGRGEYNPVAPNNTEENRAKNRRIEIFIEYTRGFIPIRNIQEFKK